MAPSSPSGIQATTDRPVAERSDVKGSDSPDGQFANLMAQFTRAPKATKAPEPTHSHPASLDKAPQAQSTTSRNDVGPARSTTPDEANPKASVPSGSQADIQAPKADDANAVTDAKTAKTDPGNPGTPLKDNQPSDDASAAVAGPLSALLPQGVIPTKDLAVETPSLLPAAGPEGGSLSKPGDATMQMAGAPSPAIPAQPGTGPLTEMEGPGKSGSAPDSSSLPVKPGTADSLQPDPQASPQIDPTQSKPQTQAQAVIAELASRMKGGSRPEGGVIPAETAGPSATVVVKSLKTADVQALALERVEAQPNPTAGPATANPQSAGSLGDDKSGAAQPSGSPESALSMLDALAAKSGGQVPTPVFHAPDGSALATTGLVPRAGDIPLVPIPTAPLAPAAQPSAPVAQIEGSLRWMLKGGAQEAELQLHPDSLGQVTIHLKVEGGEVHARLWVTEPASMQAVQEGRPHLEMALKEQGLQLGSFDLQQGHRPFQEPATTSPYLEPSFQEVAPARQEAPAALSTNILNSHHVELYA
jgi:flagellar hook-length control protein FliK